MNSSWNEYQSTIDQMKKDVDSKNSELIELRKVKMRDEQEKIEQDEKIRAMEKQMRELEDRLRQEKLNAKDAAESLIKAKELMPKAQSQERKPEVQIPDTKPKINSNLQEA